jgi:hypothetical protein
MVSAQHKLYRNPSNHRSFTTLRNCKPPRVMLAVAGLTATASLAVATGFLATDPGAANQAALLRPAAGARLAWPGTAPGTDVMAAHELAFAKSRAGQQQVRLLVREDARRAAELRADRRAARRQAELAADRRAVAQQAGQPGGGGAAAPAQPSGSPQQIAQAMLGSYGWPASQFGCLQQLWQQESGWNPYATNPSSGAYGIPQALPGSMMASAGPDWRTDPATQIRWGLGYIKQRYGSPCGAWAHEQAVGWY